jgi:hypothetical protein
MLPSVPPECPAELLKQMGADITAKVEERRASTRRELGPCLMWQERQPTVLNGSLLECGDLYPAEANDTRYLTAVNHAGRLLRHVAENLFGSHRLKRLPES